MRGLIRAELLRLRRRRSLQIIVLLMPVIVAATFLLGYNSLYETPPFDAVAYRQELLDEGFGAGLPPEELEPLLAETIEAQRQMAAQQEEQSALMRASFTFPFSLVLALGSEVFVLFALVLLTATTIGDEFGWATVRTSLLASSRRRQFLFVRFGALAVATLAIFAMLLVLGTLLPLLLNIPASKLPAVMPSFDPGAFLVLLAGDLIAALALIAFAAVITLLTRNGALTIVAAVVWVAVEAAFLNLLLRFDNFGEQGSDKWVLEAFPLRGITTLMQVAGKAATGLANYPGEVVSRDPGIAIVPIVSFSIVAAVLAAASFRRFQRMDIVE
jgi:ABC-type transport system involved in multi-copper enzyme maturation permease subunit